MTKLSGKKWKALLIKYLDPIVLRCDYFLILLNNWKM